MIKGKTVIVTGAAKGMGKDIAIEFAKNGANIVLNYRSNIDESLINEIKGYGVECIAIKADVSSFDQARDLIKKSKEKFETIDVLVNNAGITKDMLLIRMSEEEFDSVINTNLKGTFNTTRHVLSIMMKQKSGTIINMASVIGLMGNVGQGNYAASKAGVIALTKTTAREMGAKGITCNAIAPGYIETDMTDVLKDEIKSKIFETIPLKKLGSTNDVAQTAVFLAKSKYITGQVISVNGGMFMN